MNQRKLIMGVIIAAGPLLFTPAMAELYKWVDDRGVTHYSNTPPRSGNAQTVEPPPPSPLTAEQIEERLNTSRNNLEKERESRNIGKAGKEDANKPAAETQEPPTKGDAKKEGERQQDEEPIYK